ncbi:AraC family transcriptional regulator [soil metagenome]
MPTTPSPAPRYVDHADGAFGDRMGGYFHLRSAPSLSTTSFSTGQLAATRLFSGSSPLGMTETIPAEESFLCELQLSEVADHETWRRGRLMLKRGYPKDAIRILDLRDESRTFAGSLLDALSFYMPLSVIDEFADDVGAPRVGGLRCEPGITDPVIAHLGATLLPALHAPEDTSQLFFDHLALAVSAHLLHRYGGLRAPARVPVGGLSAARERKGKELLARRIDGNISIAEVASACGLSRAHFSKAFRHSTGTTPHQWLQQHKVDKARQLLSATRLPIAEIAIACGFADQSHLTRTFTRQVGMAPATWRRAAAS